jgi:glyoxylase-like metal-dependent hydrolase (beta-lactamase superfamily II)
MDRPYAASADVHVLPTHLPIPGAGVLPINAFVLHAEEPVLVDAGLAVETDDFVEALASVIDPASIRWIWLTHDDADHTGSVQRAMELAPEARLVCHGLTAMRMSSWWPVPLDRVHAIRPGDRLPVGDRTLRAVAPPLFDNPMSTGFLDEATGALFSVDSFGAILPEAIERAEDVPADALAGGMAGWSLIDSPWTRFVDHGRFGEALHAVQALAPSSILSSHLPAATGASLDGFVQVLSEVPDAPPVLGPSAEEFSAMLEDTASTEAAA